MPLVGRRGPGLVRGVARTAVIAGTAGAVHRRQEQRWAAQDQAQYDEQQAAAPPPAAPPPAMAADPNDPVAQIERLAGLHAAGQLTAEEFAAMKAKILAG